ncbi:hypothetical protein EBU71_13240 [bacterium]|nr:hypothetical protein [Candidatus Elulimicrobium humile]
MQFDDIDGVKHYFSKTYDGGEEVFEVRDNDAMLINSVRDFINLFIIKSYNSGNLASLLDGIELSTDILEKKQMLLDKIKVNYREIPNGAIVEYKTNDNEAKDLLYAWFEFLFFSDLRNPRRKSLLTGSYESTKNTRLKVSELYLNRENKVLSNSSKEIIEKISNIFDSNIEISNNNFLYIPIINRDHNSTISLLLENFKNLSLPDVEIYLYKLNESIQIYAFKKEIEELIKSQITFFELIPWQAEYQTYKSKTISSFFVISLDKFK